MKKKLRIIIIILVLIAIPCGILLYLSMNNGRIDDGKYRIVGSAEFPDAYIVVKGDELRFFNIDMNSLWQKKQYDRVIKMQNSETLDFSTGFTEEQLWEMSDLNNMFVNNPFTYDPENRTKQGTYVYEYTCLSSGNLFGVFLTYDSWNHTICVENNGIKLQFER